MQPWHPIWCLRDNRHPVPTGNNHERSTRVPGPGRTRSRVRLCGHDGVSGFCRFARVGSDAGLRPVQSEPGRIRHRPQQRRTTRRIDPREWDGTTYPIDTVVAANFDLTIYKLAYTWSFLQRDQNYLGLTAGLYVADIGTRLAAESIGAVSGSGLTAPLPVIGLQGRYDLTSRWSCRGSAEIFAIDYSDYSGSLYDLYAGLDYRLGRHWAIGAGYNLSKINAGVTADRFNGDLDWRYGGGLLFVKLDF